MIDDPTISASPSAGALVPQPVHAPRLVPATHEPPELVQILERAIDAALDLADAVADDIAAATGFGPPRGP
jgi:hypothetical protein